jgi:hypothetical protein
MLTVLMAMAAAAMAAATMVRVSLPSQPRTKAAAEFRWRPKRSRRMMATGGLGRGLGER